MNERMLNLACKAGLKKDHGSDREYIGDFDWRLFGDLIVRECVNVVKWTPSLYPNDEYVKNIKKHFGVE
jgi:hypothetical protein